MNVVRLATLTLIAIAACGPTPAPAPPAVHNAPVTAAAAPAADCGPDVATRAPRAEAVDPIDLDGDGDLDPIYRGDDDMFGNAEYLVYRVDGACATYLGSVEAFFTDTPSCESPGAPGAICPLVAHRRMMHDDYQDNVYLYVEGGFVER